MTHLKIASLAAAVAMLVASGASAEHDRTCQGAFTGISLTAPPAPNPARCGVSPDPTKPILEIKYAANGVDSCLGPFKVAGSQCLDTATNCQTDNQATATFTKTGDTATIGDCEQGCSEVNACLCTAEIPPFRCQFVAGTGGLSGVTGPIDFSSLGTASAAACGGTPFVVNLYTDRLRLPKSATLPCSK